MWNATSAPLIDIAGEEHAPLFVATLAAPEIPVEAGALEAFESDASVAELIALRMDDDLEPALAALDDPHAGVRHEAVSVLG